MGGAVLDPEAHLQQRPVPVGTDVRAERHPHAGPERLAKPLAVTVHGVLGPADEVGRERALPDPALLPPRGALPGREMRDAEGGDVPGVALAEEGHARVVHHVAVLHRVRAQRQGRLDGIRAGRVGHHGEAALPADRERRLQLLGQQEGLPVPVPGGPHDAAGEVELDVVDAGLDALADGAHEVVTSVAADRKSTRLNSSHSSPSRMPSSA